jgi:leucine dehydrogenase
MGVFDALAERNFEELLYGYDEKSGLRTIIAIHSTALGPALGGTRFYPYASEDDALRDVLRLARGMTFKAAAAGLDLGGGKAVIIGDPHTDADERLWRVYGRYVDSLHGRYITAEDVGTSTLDLAVVRKETRWAVGIPLAEGGSGDPSPATARGLMAGLRATMRFRWGSDDLKGRRVAVQGIGKVGLDLVRRLTEAGAEVIASDVYEPNLQRAVELYGVKAVSPDEILFVDCDILSPCALGDVLNAETIPKLNCEIVCGAANNQLGRAEDADLLEERGILYAPDFVVNAGGLTNVFEELQGYSADRAALHIDAIEPRTAKILQMAKERGINPHRAAVEFAQERIDRISDLRRLSRGGLPWIEVDGD